VSAKSKNKNPTRASGAGGAAASARKNTQTTPAVVGVIMGSQSDWETMQHTAQALELLGVPYETKIVSAHRTPARLVAYATTAKGRGLQVIVAGAGGAAHLPGMVASMTALPVLGVPVRSKALSGLDSLLSIAQMPGGVPVGTLAIGEAGAKNAGLLAGAIVALHDKAVAAKLDAFRAQQTDDVAETPDAA
jgi:5-(carboxyamino)imidazole ribonucleotide mutase